MARLDDHDYCLRREREERLLAASARDRSARCVHARMADEYARRARKFAQPATASRKQAAEKPEKLLVGQ